MLQAMHAVCPGGDCPLTWPTLPTTYEPLFYSSLGSFADTFGMGMASIGAAGIGYMIAPKGKRLMYAGIGAVGVALITKFLKP